MSFVSNPWLVLLCVIIQNVISNAADRQPNIILVVADDVGWNDVGYNGGTDCVTPNIDALSKTGLQLDHFYVHPMCAPTRAALMTGRYVYRYGFQHEAPTTHTIECGLNLTETFWSKVLQNDGYNTYMLGKWHLGYYQWDYTPNYRGFDEFIGFYGHEEGYYAYNYTTGVDFRNNTTPFNATTTGKYGPDLYSDITEEWLTEIANNRIDNQPFAMYLSHQAAHGPVEVNSDYVEYVNTTSKFGSTTRRQYCSIVYALDNAIGNLVSKLKSTDLWNNTILIFFSDNGPATRFGSAYPLRGTKKTYFDGGIRTPAIISGGLLPDNRSGIIENSVTSVYDIFATICSLADIDCNEYYLDGVSLYDYIFYGTSLERNYLILNVDDTSCDATICGGIIQDNMKLVIGSELIGGGDESYYWSANYIDNDYINYENMTVNCNGNQPTITGYDYNDLLWDCGYNDRACLFNLTNDPCEYNDLSGDGNYSDILTSLIQLLHYNYNAQIDTLQTTCNYNDTHSDPSNFNGFWTPWRTSQTADGTNWIVTPSPTSTILVGSSSSSSSKTNDSTSVSALSTTSSTTSISVGSSSPETNNSTSASALSTTSSTTSSPTLLISVESSSEETNNSTSSSALSPTPSPVSSISVGSSSQADIPQPASRNYNTTISNISLNGTIFAHKESDDKINKFEITLLVCLVLFVLLCCVFWSYYWYKHRRSKSKKVNKSIKSSVLNTFSKSKKVNYDKVQQTIEMDDIIYNDEKPLVVKDTDSTDDENDDDNDDENNQVENDQDKVLT